MQPEIDLFGLPLKTFGLMLALAFLACGMVAARRLEEIGRPRDWAYEMLFAAIFGGLVGARVYWVVENWSDAKGDLLGNLFGGTGLVFYGGALGGAVCVLAWAWWRGVFDLATVDLAAVPLAIGYAIGRIGCQLSGDGDYGKAWDGPWAMAYPHGTVPTTETVHPTPIYETVTMGLVAWGLWRARDAVRPGALFALWLLCAGVERFFVEFLRRNPAGALGLTTPQFESAAMALAGAAWLAVLAARGGIRVTRAGAPGRPLAMEAPSR
jgi:phosphatidylglycerol:prolipoprotein diacylglycerol transferase